MNKFAVQAVQELVRNYSIETTVQEADRIERFSDVVAPGTRVYIPHTPHTGFSEMVAVAARLRKEGMAPVPHLVARRIKTLSMADQLLGMFSGDAGVEQVLVVAGDVAPAGELESSLQILESGVLEKHGIHTIGVAGHPEGHRDVGDAALRDALRRKNAYAERTRANVYIVTQFIFSAHPVIQWERSFSQDIGQLPVMAGLPGLATAKTLLKYAIDCGVGASLQAFSKRYASITKLLTVSTPDETIVALADYKNRNPESRLAGVHFFTFGSFKRTAQWANRIVAGDFELTDDDQLKLE